MHIALHADAVVGQHMLVVLDVLAQLFAARVFQPGFELGQHQVHRQLLRHIQAFMAQRHIRGLAHLHAEGDADDAGLHFVERIGFGVQRRQLGRLELEQPGVKIGLGEDGVVDHITLLGHDGDFGRRCIVTVKQTRLAGRAAGCCLVGRRRCRRRSQRPGQALEAILLIKRHQPRGIGLAQGHGIQCGQALDIVVQRAVGLHRHQLAAERQLAAGDGIAQVLAGNALDRIGFGDQLVERAVLLQPLGSGLGAHLADAGHVVHRIAHEGLVLHHLRRRHAKLGRDPGDIAALAVHGVDDGHMLVDQLAQILVAAGDDDLDALRGSHLRQGGDHVVGLDAGHGQDLPAQQLYHLVDGGDLRAQVVGHGRTGGLVLGVERVAEGRAAGVENTDCVLSLYVFAQGLHHIDHAPDGSGSRTGRVAGNRTEVGHGMVGTVQIAGTVHQH